jgi:hypothetical protein
MPTYIRKLYIHFLTEETKQVSEKIQSQQNTQARTTGKGKRTRTVSGKAVNSFGKSN